MATATKKKRVATGSKSYWVRQARRQHPHAGPKELQGFLAEEGKKVSLATVNKIYYVKRGKAQRNGNGHFLIGPPMNESIGAVTMEEVDRAFRIVRAVTSIAELN